VGRAVCAAVAVDLSVAVAIVLADFSRGRAIDGITLLLVPAIPTLVTGQLWGKKRFVAAVFAGFFAIQLGMAAAELSRRRIAATQALA